MLQLSSLLSPTLIFDLFRALSTTQPARALNRLARAPPRTTASMITDRDLFSLAIFLGAASMILIVVYHFLEVNAVPEAAAAKKAN
ncbi:hypothetical protein PLIIFM63780_008620 [Purpureocillium lilacinum]|uniref:Uncharacterized protein n=1 Tax=Purpureocillium lilacinum TaxID=33203 RepID=A0ACC4DXS8_PURLI|nr:hypothetical protein PLICBS_008626 [Purpureocillium lilacinum]GJN85056.1 hypothetical protein PLIIFM63780_008620 [Purpureocillium lilacinum]